MRRHERGHHRWLPGELTRVGPSSHRAVHVQPTGAVTGTITTGEIPVTAASPGPQRSPGGGGIPGVGGNPGGARGRTHARYSVRFTRCVTPADAGWFKNTLSTAVVNPCHRLLLAPTMAAA
jgi:hypothetical protein